VEASGCGARFLWARGGLKVLEGGILGKARRFVVGSDWKILGAAASRSAGADWLILLPRQSCSNSWDTGTIVAA